MKELLSMENALCSVKRPKGQLKTRGLHLYDLMKSSAPLPVSIKGHNGNAVTKFPFVLGLAMRLHGDGAKAVGKKLGLSWQPFQNIVRDLGLNPLTNGLTAEEKAQRLYEEAAMESVKETRKDRTWARHPAYATWHVMRMYYADPDKHNDRCKDYHQKNKDKMLINRRKWRVGYFKNNPSARIADALRTRLSSALKKYNQEKKVSAVNNLGCSLSFLVKHLEFQFKSRMTWDNYGAVWHIDHIRPMASFNMTKKSEQKNACHYTNLQPMYAKANLKKSDKWDGQHEFTHELL